MAVVSGDDVLAIAPELGCEPPAAIDLFISMASLRVDKTVWGKFYNMGVAYLTAHLLTLKSRRGAAGIATTLKVGDVEVQYSDIMRDKKMDLGLLQTVYGVEFLQLRSLVVVAPMAV